MFGQRLKLLSLSCGRGPAFIAVAVPDGRRRLMPRAATDLERPLAPAAALPRISARILLPLARHIRSMLAASSEEACHANVLFPSGSSSAPSAAGGPAPTAIATMASAAGSNADATGPTGLPVALVRPDRGGTPC